MPPAPAASALDLIGHTPLVALDRLHPGPGRVFAKAELVQPGGSVKDRAAKAILLRARERGELRPGQPVVEMTSGNMGAGLAVVCNVLGHAFTAVMSEGNSPQRAAMLRALGAEVLLVPQVDGAPGNVTGKDIEAAAEEARALARHRGAYYVDQFRNPGSVLAHEQGTGPELWEALGGRLDAFVAIVGSGGTFVGTARFLKAQAAAGGGERVRCFAVEPEGAEVLAGKPLAKPRHLLQGTGYGTVPPLWDAALADGFVAVGDEEAEAHRRLLAVREGLHVGFSSAANVCAAAKVARDLAEAGGVADPVVATVLCDTGLKY